MNKPASNTQLSSAVRVLAVDYGRARLGLAIADSDAALVQPLATLERVNRNEDMRRLRELVREHAVKSIVVGLPLRLDGTHGEMAEEAARFARRVHKQLGLPVAMVDERLTSWEAERQLEEQHGRSFRQTSPHASPSKNRGKPAKTSVDAVAAAIILKEYLDKRRAQAACGGQ